MEPEISSATALMLAALNLASRALKMVGCDQAWKSVGNKKAVAAAMNATKTELVALESDGLLLLDIQELDRDGGALFTVLQPAPV